MRTSIQTYLSKTTDAAPLAVFRIGFGLMMCYSLLRFWANGWIETVYITPKFHFKYYGFDWIPELGNYTYLLFFICFLSACFVALGLKYRLAILTFFLSFTYIELLEKTTYLNHYYFISVLSFLLIFLPAHKHFSVDNLIAKKTYSKVPNWIIDVIKLLLGIVYFYAGLAKINSDWLLKAMPLKIWLPSKYDLPIIGESLMQQNWFHYAMSWSGMLYDLFIPFLLLYKKTRTVAFILVVFFHIFTRVLFPIGVFPYVMIVCSLIFFDAKLHHKILNAFRKLGKGVYGMRRTQLVVTENWLAPRGSLTLKIVSIFMLFQLLFPFRYLLYPGELFWTEEGYRFSWRVMLMEKMGYAQFKIVDGKTGTSFYADNTDFLTPLQEKQMSFQPDFILEYAHYLGEHFERQGHQNVQVYVDSYVALNGRPSRAFIDKTVDLHAQKESFKRKTWILPFDDEIKGL